MCQLNMLIHMQYLVCLVWPTRNQKIIREMGLKWEEMGDREIVAADGVSLLQPASPYINRLRYMLTRVIQK